MIYFQFGSTTYLGADFFPAERTLDWVLDHFLRTEIFIESTGLQKIDNKT